MQRGKKSVNAFPKNVGDVFFETQCSFLNKFAAKSYKRFPPHLNNVSTLPCET